MKTYKIIVQGDVQGVSYRYWVQKRAKQLSLSGWTKNEHDGSVTILVQGEDENIKAFEKWAWEGSPLAEVKEVAVEEVEAAEMKGFVVR